jgi:hypothetical protein
MSVLKKSFTGAQSFTHAHPQALPPNPTANTSPLLKGVRAVRVAPGTSRINLTRKEVEEKFSNYRQQQKPTNQESLWQRLTNVFGKSGTGE